MTKPEQLRRKDPQSRWFCAWCSGEIAQRGKGRRRVYCSHSCRQRAYENRKVDVVHDWLDNASRRVRVLAGALDEVEDTFLPILHGAAVPLWAGDAAEMALHLVDRDRIAARYGRQIMRGPRPKRRTPPPRWLRPKSDPQTPPAVV